MINRFFLIIVFIAFATSSCRKYPAFESAEIFLNENWTFRQAGETKWLAAKVPGDIFSDLRNNDRIEDPFYRDNEKKLQWVEKEDWEYRTTFDVPQDILKNDQVFLHFDGLDTYADVYLNNKLVLQTDNMFRYWDLPCKKQLKERNNTLRIYFHSALVRGVQKLKKLNYTLPASEEQASENEKTSMLTRKAQYQYGNEWSPRFVGCGIWRPVSIRGWSVAQVSDAVLQLRNLTKDVADYNASLNIESTKEGSYNLSFFVDDKQIGEPFKLWLKKGFNNETFNFQISKPSIWWCNGMGNHYLYSLKAQLSQGDKLITEITQKFGVRKIELVQDSDSYGRSFFFKLNGIPVFMKGANYIPQNVFPGHVSGAAYERLIKDAVAANMNMIRICGAGIYENDTLYELCDKNGILVWQDFMFYRSMQPGDTEFTVNVKQEAIQNIKKLRNHPCLALWCGNHEILTDWNKRNLKSQYPKDISLKIWNDYEKLFYDVLPATVKKYDPMTAYWTSSPSSFENKLPDKKSGDEHEWRVWKEAVPFSAFSEKPGRFVSAYGMQSFPSLKTLLTFANDTDLEVHSTLMDFRQRSNMPWINPTFNGNQMVLNYIQMYYNDPSDFESLVYLSQVMQSEALKTAIEAHRINRPKCMGSLYWQLNDCWPTMSWSTIDYFGRWKPSHYTVGKSFANILVVPQHSSGWLRVFAVNDSLVSLEAELQLKIIDFEGKKIWSETDTITIMPDTAQLLWKGREDHIYPGTLSSKTFFLAQLVSKNKIISENLLYFIDPKYLDLPVPDISYKINGKIDHYELVLITDKFAKNVVLDTFEKDAHFSDNNFDLLPGRELRLTVTYPGTREELLNDLKIYSLVNSF